MSTDIRTDEIVSSLRQQLESFDCSEDIYESGTVHKVGDGIASITGLLNVMAGELIEIIGKEKSIPALVMHLETNSVAVAVLGNTADISQGDSTRRTKAIASVPVGDTILGRVINSLGEPIDGGQALDKSQMRPIRGKTPRIRQRQNVDEFLETGLKIIDILFPLGRGECKPILGDRKTGKTTIAIDAILNQRGKGTKCIYVAIGQRQSGLARIVECLKAAGAMEYTCILAANASDPVSMQNLAPFSGVTMGEYFMYNGQHALVIFDDLTKHAQAYDQLSRLFRRLPNHPDHPTDLISQHASLLNRAAMMSNEEGGGSLTILPIIESQSSDLTPHISNYYVSFSDRSIFLNLKLFFAGQRPAVDIGSLGMFQYSPHIKATRYLVKSLWITLLQYSNLRPFFQFAADLDKVTNLMIARGERMMHILRQKHYAPYRIGKTVLIVYAGLNRYVDDVPITKIALFEEQLFQFIDANYPSLLDTIEARNWLDHELIDYTEKAINEFRMQFN